MFFCQKKSLKISGRQSLTGRIILNAYPVIWLLPESNIRTMQLPSSVGQDRIIWKDYIERLSGYMASTGKQYQNHAATIIRWARQDHPASRQRNYESEEYETL